RRARPSFHMTSAGRVGLGGHDRRATAPFVPAPEGRGTRGGAAPRRRTGRGRRDTRRERGTVAREARRGRTRRRGGARPSNTGGDAAVPRPARPPCRAP